MLKIKQNTNEWMKGLRTEIQVPVELDQEIIVRFNSHGRDSAGCAFDVEGKGQVIFDDWKTYAHGNGKFHQEILGTLKECFSNYGYQFTEDEENLILRFISESFQKCDSTYGCEVNDWHDCFESDAYIRFIGA